MIIGGIIEIVAIINVLKKAELAGYICWCLATFDQSDTYIRI